MWNDFGHLQQNSEHTEAAEQADPGGAPLRTGVDNPHNFARFPPQDRRIRPSLTRELTIPSRSRPPARARGLGARRQAEATKATSASSGSRLERSANQWAFVERTRISSEDIDFQQERKLANRACRLSLTFLGGAGEGRDVGDRKSKNKQNSSGNGDPPKKRRGGGDDEPSTFNEEPAPLHEIAQTRYLNYALSSSRAARCRTCATA